MDEEKARPNPFGMLLAPPPARLPLTGSVTVVVAGMVLPKGRPLKKSEARALLDGEEPEQLQAQRRQLQEARRAHQRAANKRKRSQPNEKARRAEDRKRNHEKRKATLAAWEARNKERRRAYKTAWARRQRLVDSEALERKRDACRRYQAKNREELNAKARAQRAARTPEQKAIDAAKRRAYVEKNRDKINAQHRASKARAKARKGGE